MTYDDYQSKSRHSLLDLGRGGCADRLQLGLAHTRLHTWLQGAPPRGMQACVTLVPCTFCWSRSRTPAQEETAVCSIRHMRKIWCSVWRGPSIRLRNNTGD